MNIEANDVIAALEEQRNTSLTSDAQHRALVAAYKRKVAELEAEIEKLKAPTE